VEAGTAAQSIGTVPVFGAADKPGPYAVLVKWHPGYMTVPHSDFTACSVSYRHLACEFGRKYRPGGTIAMAFVPRVAHTPHFDGVKKGDKQPAVICIFGQAPDRVQTD
jgi:hypothetical protein